MRMSDISLRSSRLDDDPDRNPRPRTPSEPKFDAPPIESSLIRQTAHHAGLGLASVLGTLIRLGLESLDDGKAIFQLAWAQGVGCGIMGFSISAKDDIDLIYSPFYTFLTTGVAGSTTTFSSWMLEGYEAFSNFDGYSRGGFHDAVDGLAYSFATLAISLACIYLGEHAYRAIALTPIRRLQPFSVASEEQVKYKYKRRRTFDIITIATFPLTYLIALLLYFFGPSRWRHDVIFPLLLSPPGALLRYFLSRLNNKKNLSDRFPLGTFLANISATLIIAGVFAAQRRPAGGTRCNALNGIEQGFCGCLSTVSTFVVEIRRIKTIKWKWGYLFGSVILGHLLVFAIVGGMSARGLVAVCTG